MRELDIYANYVAKTFDHSAMSTTNTQLKNCVVIIDLDGNELGFTVRSAKMDDWPVITYNPDGGDFEFYAWFHRLDERWHEVLSVDANRIAA